MLTVKTDFADKCAEIDEYYSHLRLATEDNSLLEVPSPISGGSITRARIADRTKKVLMANTFLLLYNLVEATVRNVLEHVYAEMERQGLTYAAAVAKVRQLYVEQCGRPLREGNFRMENLYKSFIEFGDLIIVGTTLRMIHEQQNIGGNLDDQRIRDLAKKHGIDPPNVKGDVLTTIRMKRNNLAHGHNSFSAIGSNLTIGELESIRTETYDFLNNFLDKVEDYLAHTKYRS